MNRPEEDFLGGEIVTLVPQSGHVGELAKCPVEILYYAVGGIETIHGYEFPDLPKVAESSAGKGESLQARIRRRSAL
jgi:hypothetical protein